MNKYAFKIGDKVAYSVQFLRSIGESHGKMARGRGEITELKDYGITLAVIRWGEPVTDLPGMVNVGNLAKVGANAKFCSC